MVPKIYVKADFFSVTCRKITFSGFSAKLQHFQRFFGLQKIVWLGGLRQWLGGSHSTSTLTWGFSLNSQWQGSHSTSRMKFLTVKKYSLTVSHETTTV